MESENVVNDVATEAEKMLPQSHVNKLVGEARTSAAQKAREEALREFQAQQSQTQHSYMPANQSFGMGGMDEGKIADTVFSKVLEKAQEHQRQQVEAQQQAEAKRIVDEFDSKMAQGRLKHPDFDEVMKDFNPAEFLDVVLLANSMDGTADMLYELARNPMKLSNVSLMAQKSPKLAMKLLNELGESIKVNEEALQNKVATKAPLPRVSPSTAGTDHGGPQTVSDFKNASWLQV